MNTAQIIARLWRAKAFIAASGVTCGASALGISYMFPDQYFATAGVQLDNIVQSDVQSYHVSSKQIDQYVKTQGEMARDFRVTGRVVDRLGWTNNFQLAQQYNREGAASGLDFRSWLARGIRAGVQLNFQEGSPSFQIGYSGFSPREARMMAGLVRDEFLSYSLEKRRQEAEANAEWVDGQIADLSEQMRQLEERNARFSREANLVITPEGLSMAEVRLRNAARAQEIILPSRSGSSVANPAVRELAQVEAELASLSQSLGPNHPDIVSLRNRQQELRSAAATPVTPSRPSARPDNARVLQMRRQEYEAKADDIAVAKRYFDELEALREQFETLTLRREGFDLDAGTMRGGAVAVGEPVLQSGVYFPNRPLAVGVATGFGLLFSALLALFLSLLQLRIATPRDLELLDVERFGAKPDKKSKRKAGPSEEPLVPSHQAA